MFNQWCISTWSFDYVRKKLMKIRKSKYFLFTLIFLLLFIFKIFVQLEQEMMWGGVRRCWKSESLTERMGRNASHFLTLLQWSVQRVTSKFLASASLAAFAPATLSIDRDKGARMRKPTRIRNSRVKRSKHGGGGRKVEKGRIEVDISEALRRATAL